MKRTNKKGSGEAEILEKLGLSGNEAVLYTLMLSRPQSTVRELRTYTPFPRTLLYHVLDLLIQKGLVRTSRRDKRTTYAAENPDILYEHLAAREREHEHVTSGIRKLIPELKNKYRLLGKRPTVRTFEGVDAYEKALADVFVSGAKEIYSFETVGKNKAARELRESHERSRALRKIRKRVLFFENEQSLSALSKISYNDYTEYRGVLTENTALFDADVMLYTGKVLYTSFNDPNEPSAILIEDERFFAMQKSLFGKLWKEGKDRTLHYIEK